MSSGSGADPARSASTTTTECSRSDATSTCCAPERAAWNAIDCAAERLDTARLTSRANQITAPARCRVLEILVQHGQTVKKDQPLISIEKL